MTSTTAASDASFASQWERYRTRSNQQLKAFLFRLPRGETQALNDAIQYSTLNGGKRFRAMLVYASGACFGARAESLDAPAVALELIHAYSLVHDDLPAMDDDDLRRGRASCHIEFDEATAILAGDALQSLAYQALAEHNEFLHAPQQLAMIKQLAISGGISGMVGGQSLDIIATGQALNQSALQSVHERKTGALIRAALTLGALAAPGITDRELEHIDEYGRLIGLAFQVVDDILDQTQSSERLGKQSGADAAMDKNTYPALMGLSAAQEYANQLVQNAQQSLVKLSGDTDFLLQLAEFTRFRDH